jgi:hypothetical protein
LLRTLGEFLKEADVPEEDAHLLPASYERIVVAGPKIARVRLTSAAYAHGFGAGAAGKVCNGAPDRSRARGCQKYPVPDRILRW